MKARYMGPRRYPRGAIRKAIIEAMPLGVPMRTAEICARIPGIEYEAVRRNVSTMKSAGEIENSGAWHAAIYRRIK